MRLIDADELIKVLNKDIGLERTKEIQVKIMEQPTVYDMENVVEQLEKCKKAYPFGTWFDMVEEATVIVKGGGIDEQY